jgi:hypothetical protein
MEGGKFGNGMREATRWMKHRRTLNKATMIHLEMEGGTFGNVEKQ